MTERQKSNPTPKALWVMQDLQFEYSYWLVSVGVWIKVILELLLT